MRKTNIQIDGKFLAYDDGSYFMTNITNLNTWKESEKINTLNDVTSEVTQLMKKYKIDHSVNFLRSQSGG